MMNSDISPKRLRTIRSFVCREGRLTPAQAKALSELGDQYLLIATQSPFDFSMIYQNSRLVVLEIGFGMGHSLLEQAKQFPQINFLGVEVHRPGIGALLSGMAREGVTNIRLVHADVVEALQAIPEQSLHGVQIFFPDPWHKKRHHKRRLIQLPFVQALVKKIQPGGYLHCATDWEDYAQQMLAVMNAVKVFGAVDFIARPETRPVTKFERRGLKLGHGIWDIRGVLSH